MTSYREAVDSWTEHLRSGGTTTWATWVSWGDEPDGTATPGGASAAHLEVARRLNALTGTAHPTLVDLVLHAPPTGRGQVDPPLPWPGGARFGTPAVEPDQLPTTELLRIAVPVLAGLLPTVPPGEPAPIRPPRAWPWRHSVRVAGSRLTVDAVRAGLREQGVPTSRRRATHLVVARPLEVMMAEHWHARSLRGGAAKWWRVWRRALAVDDLPPSVQPDLLASRRTARGRSVHVVVAATDDRLTDLVAGAVGHRVPLPSAPDPNQTDLLRLLNPVLAITAGRERTRALVDVLNRRVLPDARASLTTPPAPLAVPPWAHDWAVDRAREMAERIRSGGYAVHGDPDDLVPTDRPGASSTVDRDRTLELALAAGVRAWQLQGGTR